MDRSEKVEAPATGHRPTDNHDILHLGVITEPSKDIAINENLDRLIVGVAGRQRLQRIFVRQVPSNKGSGKTTITYDETDDAPPDGRPLSILPTEQEIQSRAGTVEFLVVGIMLAKDTKKFSTKGSGSAKSKQRDADRRARGVMPAEKNILRVIVQTTDYISLSHKYYVACRQVHGLCDMRVVSSDMIFYFSEIWDGVSQELNSKQRKTALGLACKTLAARDKKPPQRALVQVSEPDWTPSNVISITPVENAANRVLMQYSVYELTRKPSTIAALKQTLENMLPDLLNRPTDDGILAFYDFDCDLGEADAKLAVDAVKVSAELVVLLS